MKYSVFYDENREEEVLIYAHRKTELDGYSDDEIVKIDIDDACCFYSKRRQDRVFQCIARRLAYGHTQKRLPRLRLAQTDQSGQGKDKIGFLL